MAFSAYLTTNQEVPSMRRLFLSLSITAALLAATVPAFAAPSDETGEEIGPAVGSAAPDFTLQALDGREVSLSDFRGEAPVVLVFFRGAW